VRPIAFFGLVLFLSTTSTFAQEKPTKLSIQNDSLTANWDPSGTFEVIAKKTGRAFLQNGKFEGQVIEAGRKPITDPTFGQGESIEIGTAGGSTHLLMLFPNLPFVLFRTFLYNGGGEIAVIRDYRPLSFALDPGKTPNELRAFGTAGLTAPDKNPGSYVYLALADPVSRHGVVCGWVTHDRGNGVIFSRVEKDRVIIDPRIDYGRLPLLPGQPTKTETFAAGYFDDARLGLEGWADTVAKIYRIRLRPQVSGYCTWYSKPNGGASDEQHIVELAEFAARELKPFGLSFIQIDDKWQMGKRRNGPGKNFTTHDPQGPYPHGMKATTDKLVGLGFTAGLWFMPFAGDHLDPFFTGHPEWFVKKANGEPYETSWGGTSLDMTEPGAREHLRSVVKNIRDWGYRYFKMDGLWTGSATAQVYVNDGYREDNIGDAVFSNPDKTNIEAMRDGLKLAREAAGPEVFFSGCNLSQNMRSFSGSVGLVDSMRIGPDNGPDWPKGPSGRGLLSGPTHGSRKYFMHGRIWWNDPDPIYVRATMPLQHARLIASWVAISGQIYLSSDWLPELPAERLEILKRTIPSHGLLPRPVDLFESPIPRIWLLTDDRTNIRRDVVALYNWDNEEKTIEYPVGKIGLDAKKSYQVFDFWENQLLPQIEGVLRVSVPAQSCRILALRPNSDRPQLLSASRHVTQGIVDVLEEKWDQATKVLQGTSRIVVNDPYELRVSLPAGDRAWRLKSAQVAGAGRPEGVITVSVKAEAGLVRITLNSPSGGEVRWTLSFDH
jgi:hypothetical protein